MCTVAFVPEESGAYLLAHNRDERRTRGRGRRPAPHAAGDRRFVAPGDPDGGGTWIGVNDRGLTVCALNHLDAPGRELPDPPPSRGLLVAAALSRDSADEVVRGIAQDGERLGATRAFRIVAVEPGRSGGAARLATAAWDGRDLRVDTATETALFVASTLGRFGADVARRASWERLLAERPSPDEGDLRRFLASHEPERGLASVCMHGDYGGTVSGTIVAVSAGGIRMLYADGPPCTVADWSETRVR